MLKQNLNYKQQKGFTLVGWLFIIVLILFFAYLAMILTPVVMDDLTTSRVLKSLKEEPGITQMSNQQIWVLIQKRLTINGVRDLKKEDFEIIKEPNVVTVYLDYDEKVKFMKNIFILIEHSKSVELIRN